MNTQCNMEKFDDPFGEETKNGEERDEEVGRGDLFDVLFED